MNESINVTDGIAQHWYNGDWFSGLTAPFTGTMGEAVAASMLMFMVVGGIWIYSQKTDLTVVVMILLGGMLTSALPGQARYLMFLIMMVGTAYALWRVYARRGQ